ncbi:hypothetical protein ABFA07_000595 [Porites harrisoni]
MNSKFVFLLLVAILVTASYASLLEEFDEAYATLMDEVKDAVEQEEDSGCSNSWPQNRCNRMRFFCRPGFKLSNLVKQKCKLQCRLCG